MRNSDDGKNNRNEWDVAAVAANADELLLIRARY